MRLRSEIVVSALLRKVQSNGGFGAVLKKGEAQAGAIHILVRQGLGECRHFAPANQSFYDVGDTADRLFEERGILRDADIATFIEKESRFDPDFWIVELEPAEGDLPFAVIAE